MMRPGLIHLIKPSYSKSGVISSDEILLEMTVCSRYYSP